jgi:hypothetical protein
MSEEMLSVEQVEEILLDREVCGLDEEELPVGKVLIFSAFVGEDDAKLVAVSGVPLEQVFSITKMLIKNGVFGVGIDHHKDYFENPHSTICLNCDIACGRDMLKRTTKNGEAHYQMTEPGLKHVEEEILSKPEGRAFMDSLDAQEGKKPGAWRKSWKGKRKFTKVRP